MVPVPASSPLNSPPKKRRRLYSDGENKEDSNKGDIMNYVPAYFLRCHSYRNNPADVQTEVWQCKFEPDIDDQKKTTNIVATTGGGSISLIDVTTCELQMKYVLKQPGDTMFSLSWTTLNLDKDGTRRTNILAAGGTRGKVLLIHPVNRVCYHEIRVLQNHHSVYYLTFHTANPTWLICGTSSGLITMWDIGIPELPEYKVQSSQLLTFSAQSPVCNLLYSPSVDVLLVATEDGIKGWHLSVDVVNKGVVGSATRFVLPSDDVDGVDALALLSDDIVACKVPCTGRIYLWKLAEFPAVKEIKVELLTSLQWSNNDGCYMNIGTHKGTGFVCCGDDEGTLWMYDLRNILESNSCDTALLEETVQLLWPNLFDKAMDNSKKLSIDRNEIIINDVSFNWSGEYCVAVTSRNLVCIWHRVAED